MVTLVVSSLTLLLVLYSFLSLDSCQRRHHAVHKSICLPMAKRAGETFRVPPNETIIPSQPEDEEHPCAFRCHTLPSKSHVILDCGHVVCLECILFDCNHSTTCPDCADPLPSERIDIWLNDKGAALWQAANNAACLPVERRQLLARAHRRLVCLPPVTEFYSDPLVLHDKEIYWRSRRGMLELDLLLVP